MPQGDTPPELASTPAAGTPVDALLTGDQIRRLKIAIGIMSVLMIVGIVALIGRVIYLASGRGVQAVAVPAVVSAVPGATVGDIQLALPLGAAVTSASTSGVTLTVLYAAPAGDGVLVVDLASGRTVSHVRFTRTR